MSKIFKRRRNLSGSNDFTAPMNGSDKYAGQNEPDFPTPGDYGTPGELAAQNVYNPTALDPVALKDDLKLATDKYANNIAFNTTMHWLNNAQSINVLPQNIRRQLLTVQNQSADKVLWVNFSQDAGVNQGFKIAALTEKTWDNCPPNSPIYLFFDDSVNQPACVIEGTPLT